jgi:hypothetical protein
MKIRSLVIILLAAILPLPALMNSSCSSAKSLAAIDIYYTFHKVYFTYTATKDRATELNLYTAKLTIDMDSILTANHIPSGVIQSAYLSRLALQITAPPEATFNWLQSVRMVGCSDSTFQKTTELGHTDTVSPYTQRVDMTLNPVDLKPILMKNSYYLRILATPSGQTPAAPTISLYADSEIKLHIQP